MRRITVMMAVGEESTPLIRSLGLRAGPEVPGVSVYSGPGPISLAISGAGLDRCRRATRAVVARLSPELLVSAGLSGGLAPELSCGDTLVVSGALTLEGQRFTADLGWMEAAGDPLAGTPSGPVVTVDHVVVTEAEKRRLGALTQALAVDMECAAVAEVASQSSLPWAALRAISDPLQGDLPLDFNRCWNSLGQPHTARIAWHTLCSGRVPGMVRFARHVFRARRRLTRALVPWLQALAR